MIGASEISADDLKKMVNKMLTFYCRWCRPCNSTIVKKSCWKSCQWNKRHCYLVVSIFYLIQKWENLLRKKVSVSGVFLARIFPLFGLNAEIYHINLRIHSESGRIRTRKTTNRDNFHAVVVVSFYETFGVTEDQARKWEQQHKLSSAK